MKILIYTHEFIPYKGGVATYNYELANGLSELGHEVIVVAPSYSTEDSILDKKMPFNVVRTNLPIYSIMESNRSLVMLPVTAYRFIKVLRHYQPDCILITEHAAHESAALARLYYPFRFTLTVHGTEVYLHFARAGIKGWLKRWLMKCFFHKADRLICVSDSTKNLLEETVNKLQSKTSVIHIGIGLNKLSIKDNPEDLIKRFNLYDGKVILTVARLSSGKGQDVVIKALPKVVKEIPKTKYLVVGGGPTRSGMEKLSEALGVKESVLFAGSINREYLDYFYDRCDLFVMVSRRGKRESFGIVYLEAWKHEKPVIGGCVGGVGEVIEHEKTGLLIEPNDVNAVSEAICRLLRNEDLAKKMGKAGRQKLEREFSRQAMAQKTLELL